MRLTFSAATAVLTIAVVATLASTASALAAPTWTQVSERSGSNTDEVSAVRAPDGSLRIVYVDHRDGLTDALRTRVLSLKGTWSTPTSVQEGWVNIIHPDIELMGGIPTVFWAGQGSTDVADPTSSGRAWAATLGGVTWTRATDPITELTSPYASSQFSSAIDATGQPWFTWTGTNLLATHAGAIRAGTEQNLSAGCCQYGANLERETKANAMYVVYHSNETGAAGTYMRRLTPVVAAPVKLIGSGTGSNSLGRTTRVPATPRVGGGVYTAYCATYPRCTKLRVTSNSGKSLIYNVPAGAKADTVWAAAAPSGRLWLMWAQGTTVWAVRSNASLTKWGTPVKVGAPKSTATVWTTYGEASRGFLDLVANVTARGAIRQFHSRVLPGLTVKKPAPVRATGSLLVVRIYIADASAGVRGTVTMRGVTRTTDGNGRATFILPPNIAAGTYDITAKASGYTPGTGKLRVTR